MACKNFTQRGQNQDIVNDLSFVISAFSQLARLLNVRLEYSRSDHVFEQPRLRNSFNFGNALLITHLFEFRQEIT